MSCSRIKKTNSKTIFFKLDWCYDLVLAGVNVDPAVI